MAETITLEDLILLAEGVGWERVYPQGDLCQGINFFVTSLEHVIWFDEDNLVQWFEPHLNLRHAGMLMQKLAINLCGRRLGGKLFGWRAHPTDESFDYEYKVEGTDEPAMCEAVCRCAREILKAREATRA